MAVRRVVEEAVVVRRLAQDVQLCASVLKSAKTVEANNLRLFCDYKRWSSNEG